jgi:predicted Zn-dependent protease
LSGGQIQQVKRPTLSPDEQRDLLRSLKAVQGYLHLGMHSDAWNELENIPSEHRARPEVLKIRVDVCRAMQKWDMVVEVTKHLAHLEPDDPWHVINQAAAVRKLQGEQIAANILEEAKGQFPHNAIVAYNLACYKAVLGDVNEAKTLLAEAFTHDASLRVTSLDDPDLVGIWDSFQET